ncbi:MAG: DUF3303 family protein [Chloroflexi bacterium]|nr:DUF3303 family protein [Chloroflexota bacterium]
MQFMTYFELSENLSESERLGASGKIMEKGLFPPEGLNVISWTSSPDLWGVLICEAETVEQVVRGIAVWRLAVPGFFKMTKTAPAMPVQEILPLIGEISQTING